MVACAQYPPVISGYAKVASALANGFSDSGARVEIITEGRGCKTIGRVHYLSAEGCSLLKRKPDIVQVVGPSPLFSEQVVLYAKRLRLPIVYKIDMFPGLATYHPGVLSEAIDSAYRSTVYSRSLRSADVVVCSTRDFADTLAQVKAPVEVIPLGVDDPCLSQIGSIPPNSQVYGRGRVGEELVILFVGQLRPYKGVRILLEAARNLVISGFKFRLNIVGDGPDRQSLEDLASSLSLGSLVRFLGPLPGSDLHSQYLGADVLVLPSTAGESFGIVVLEAALHGLGVIGSDLPGLREVVVSVNGKVFPTGNVEALSEAIQREKPREFKKFNSAVAQRYSWRGVCAKYLSLYDRLLSGGSFRGCF